MNKKFRLNKVNHYIFCHFWKRYSNYDYGADDYDTNINYGAEVRLANSSKRIKRYSRDESHFEIVQVHRQTSFTDKIQTRAYTFDDVVGTVGGYIGMFLGYAMVQIPGSIALILNSMKQRRNKGKTNYDI